MNQEKNLTRPDIMSTNNASSATSIMTGTSANLSDNASTEDKTTLTTTEPDYPSFGKTLVIVLSVFLTMFLVALDRTIIGTAIPTITDQFHSLGDVGWYASAYLLTASSFMLFMGRVYTFYNPKWIFLASVVVFEVGSVVCGAARNSTTLIVGRAIAGLGNAGIGSGAIVIVVHIIPLHKRPMWTGFGGLVFGIASVLGPLLGGALTDKVSWRWCFYINIPVGVVAWIIVALVLHIPQENLKHTPSTLSQKIHQLDPFGTLVFIPGIVCLLLALQWGGLTYDWSDVRLVVLLIISGILLSIFVIIQKYKKTTATVPPHIFLNRSIIAGSWFTFCSGGSMMTVLYFLPLWFQAIKSADAVHSGIMNIPMVLAIVLASISAGILTKKIGYFTPWMVAGSILTPIGIGLITTFTPTTTHSAWIGFQVLYGLGLGLGMQQPSVAAQTTLAKKDVPTGVALMFFSQTLGGTIFVSIANNIFDSKLSSGLAQIKGLDVGAVIKIGATELRSVVPIQYMDQVTLAYNTALVHVFYVALAASCATVLGAICMEWKSVKKGVQQPVAKDEESAPKEKVTAGKEGV